MKHQHTTYGEVGMRMSDNQNACASLCGYEHRFLTACKAGYLSNKAHWLFELGLVFDTTHIKIKTDHSFARMQFRQSIRTLKNSIRTSIGLM